MSTINKNNITLLTNPGDPRPLAEFNGKIIGVSTDFDPEKCGINPIQKKLVKSKRPSKKLSLKKGGGLKDGVSFKDRKPFAQRFPNHAPSLIEQGYGKVTSSTITSPGIRNKSHHPRVSDIENQLYIAAPKKSALKKKGGGKKTRKYKKRQKRQKRKTRRIK